MTDQIKTIYSKFVSPVKKSTGIDLSEIGHAHAVNIILQELQNDNRTEKEKKDLPESYRLRVYVKKRIRFVRLYLMKKGVRISLIWQGRYCRNA